MKYIGTVTGVDMTVVENGYIVDVRGTCLDFGGEGHEKHVFDDLSAALIFVRETLPRRG